LKAPNVVQSLTCPDLKREINHILRNKYEKTNLLHLPHILWSSAG